MSSCELAGTFVLMVVVPPGDVSQSSDGRTADEEMVGTGGGSAEDVLRVSAA